MEHLPDAEHGTIAGILLVLCLHLLLNLFKTLRDTDNKKIEHLTKSMEENTKAVSGLTKDLKDLNNRIVETDVLASKQEISHKRLVATVKELAGEKWIDIQEKVRKEEFLTGDK